MSTNVYSGLSDVEVLRRQAFKGMNELPSSAPKPAAQIVLKVLKEPMFLLLVSCGTLYMMLGDITEGFMLLASVLILIAVSYYQERKAQRALEALRELSSPRTLVIRNSREVRVASKELVAGDIMLLREGDRIAADARLLQATNLKLDESMLSGESYAVDKGTESTSASELSTIHHDHVYAGSLIVRGTGIAEVVATGVHTELGKIGKSLLDIDDEPTLLQRETGAIVKTFSIIGFGVCLLLIIIYGVTRDNWLEGMLAGLSLAMAMLPEEFAVVLTIFMAVGAWRLSQQNVLTRHSAAIEALGAVTVLCVDKTGTLTENRMNLAECYVPGHPALQRDSRITQELIHLAAQACALQTFDPMEKAIRAADTMQDDEQIFVREYPISPALLMMSIVYRRGNDWVIACKGSPEAVMRHCGLDENNHSEAERRLFEMAGKGMRVIAVAGASWSGKDLPSDQSAFQFQFAGLLGLEDPLRSSIDTALRDCRNAGIRVVMITGDHKHTAAAIAKKAGLLNADEVLSGKELADLNDIALKEKLSSCNVFARILPEQKLRLVSAFKENGEIVAMTGDGVNDAPALKTAHVGIAMGGRGTDVARESADLVLLDDNFSSIINAIRSGRRIYDNMQKAMAYIFSVHLPIAGLTLVPVFFKAYPVVLFPLHIALMELIIDPASTLIFENEQEEKEIMQRPPRDSKRPVFGIKRIIVSSVQGAAVLLVCLIAYFYGILLQVPEDNIRTICFVTLILANIGLIFINRSQTRTVFETLALPNRAAGWIASAAIAFIMLLIYVPFLQKAFHLATPRTADWFIIVALASAGVLWFDLVKLLKRWLTLKTSSSERNSQIGAKH